MRNERKISDIMVFIGDGTRHWQEIFDHMRNRNCTRNQLNMILRNRCFEVVGTTPIARFGRETADYDISIYKVRKLYTERR